MSISIVIVTYNSSKIISKLLNSVKNQSDLNNNIEVIIIDNNSPDQNKLKVIIQKFKYNNPKLNIFTKYKKKNYGFGTSCNYGASFANFENILFLNPDTILTKKCLFILTQHFRHTKSDISGGKCIHVNSIETHRTVFNKPTFRTMLFEFSNLGKITRISGNFYVNQESLISDQVVDGVGGAFLLVKKISFDRLSGFDKNIFMYLEDVDMCTRAKRMGMKITYCPHAIIKHIGGASSNNKYHILSKAWFDSREYYAIKNFSAVQSTILLVLYKVERLLLEVREKLYQT